MEKFTPKLIEKAKTAKSVEKLLAIAEENEVVLALDEAKTYFEQLNPKCGELDVSGGGCSSTDDGGLAPAEPQLCAGQRVLLKEPGHTFGSCYCQNSVCASPCFRIVKQIDAEKYLLQCDRCDWTYHALKENILLL